MREDAPSPPGRLARIVGLGAIIFSTVYIISDVLEVAEGDFTTFRLLLTYAGEAAIPLFVLGLYAVQKPRIGLLGLFGALTYAYSYVFFTSTVVYVLIAKTANYRTLTALFGPWMTVHRVIMLVGGVTFGLAVVRADVLPRWTGICLMVGVVAVAAAANLPTFIRTIAEFLPCAAFIGMGVALCRGNASRRSGPMATKGSDRPEQGELRSVRPPPQARGR